MLVFWEQGYEGASLTDLTDAMGITRTSMYAAFGNKEELFRKALERYTEGPGAYVGRALKEPTAWEVATAFLAGTVRTTTCPASPPGAWASRAPWPPATPARWPATPSSPGATRAAPVCGSGSSGPSTKATCPRAPIRSCSPATSSTVANGIAVQAASGAGRDALQKVADMALRNWPPA